MRAPLLRRTPAHKKIDTNHGYSIKQQHIKKQILVYLETSLKQQWKVFRSDGAHNGTRCYCLGSRCSFVMGQRYTQKSAEYLWSYGESERSAAVVQYTWVVVCFQQRFQTNQRHSGKKFGIDHTW